MKKLLIGAAMLGAVLTVAAPAQAQDHRGERHERHVDRGHRGDRGGWNHGHRGREVWVDGRFYRGRGYYSQGRWWKHRERHHGGWRYR